MVTLESKIAFFISVLLTISFPCVAKEGTTMNSRKKTFTPHYSSPYYDKDLVLKKFAYEQFIPTTAPDLPLKQDKTLYNNILKVHEAIHTTPLNQCSTDNDKLAALMFNAACATVDNLPKNTSFLAKVALTSATARNKFSKSKTAYQTAKENLNWWSSWQTGFTWGTATIAAGGLGWLARNSHYCSSIFKNTTTKALGFGALSASSIGLFCLLKSRASSRKEQCEEAHKKWKNQYNTLYEQIYENLENVDDIKKGDFNQINLFTIFGTEYKGMKEYLEKELTTYQEKSNLHIAYFSQYTFGESSFSEGKDVNNSTNHTKQTQGKKRQQPNFRFGVTQHKEPSALNTSSYFENKTDDYIFFGICNGHECESEADVVQKTAQSLNKNILPQQKNSVPVNKILYEGFLATHKNPANITGIQKTAVSTVVAYIQNGILYVANAGNTRAILAHNRIAIALSQDHTPYNREEKHRIEAAGKIAQYGIIDNEHKIARALGNKSSEVIIPNPDICEHQLIDNDNFLILISKNLQKINNQDAVDIVSTALNNKPNDFENAADALKNAALEYGNRDNITVIVVDLKGIIEGKSKGEGSSNSENRKKDN